MAHKENLKARAYYDRPKRSSVSSSNSTLIGSSSSNYGAHTDLQDRRWDGVHSEDQRSPLLKQYSGAVGGEQTAYATFPDVLNTPNKKQESWPHIAKCFIFAMCLMVILRPILSAGVRYLDPHDGVESRQHQLEHRKWELERKKEEERQASERKKWAEEEERMRGRRQTWLDEWEEDRKLQMELRRREREEWAREQLEEQQEREKERAEWDMLRKSEEELKEKERQRWEEEKRDMDSWRYRHSGAYWSTPEKEKCAAYGIRQYSALLLNVPSDFDPRKTCQNMNITIQDLVYDEPKWCEDQGNKGVYGHWWVDASDSGEPDCKPYWDRIQDKGCTGPGSSAHRYESSLKGLIRGESWEKLCATAPAKIRNVEFSSPTYCEYRGGDVIWGIWDLEDRSC